MIRLRKRHLLMAPLLIGTAFGQIEEIAVEDQEEELRRYTVEMIILTYNEDVSIGSEVFVADSPPPEALPFDGLEQDRPDAPNVEAQAPVELSEQETDVPSAARRYYAPVMLTEEEFTMDEIYGHLRRLDVYEPVLHFGWTEVTLPADEAEIRPLSSFVTLPAELGLEGDIQLYLGRYLHLVVNLSLDAPSAPFAGSEEPPVRYRIEEDRIFKNGDIRYFDHPKFGVLAKITRWEQQDAADFPEEFLGDTELAGVGGQ